mmetsp:Transcript_19101/g.56632  ORF Transcript_19101/g.56632 Transcript_19101/m.56632 type:complete len:203 (-) Transcript_19101:274-882(-)
MSGSASPSSSSRSAASRSKEKEERFAVGGAGIGAASTRLRLESGTANPASIESRRLRIASTRGDSSSSSPPSRLCSVSARSSSPTVVASADIVSTKASITSEGEGAGAGAGAGAAASAGLPRGVGPLGLPATMLGGSGAPRAGEPCGGEPCGDETADECGEERIELSDGTAVVMPSGEWWSGGEGGEKSPMPAALMAATMKR